MNTRATPTDCWRLNPVLIGWFVLLAILLAIVFHEALATVMESWTVQEEYSHGMLIPLITIYLIWHRRTELAQLTFKGSWPGVAMVAGGLILFLLGELATLYIIQQYALVIVIMGTVLAITGSKAFAIFVIPVAMLFFVIPLPNFLLFGLSAKLQLLSSQLGVAFIRLFDISVYLEGNVIDLGNFKLQVVEACSGLRYLFPLMSLAFICAYFYREATWKRILVFFSSIPITVLMNSFRIGLIGILVDRFGQSMAEGFLHDFEGWAVFMACTAVLMAEMWLLAKLGRQSAKPFSEVFGLEEPVPLPENAVFHDRQMPRQYWPLLGLTALALITSLSLQNRTEELPPRAQFAEFPIQLGTWQGKRETMEQLYLDTLKLDDYLLVNYQSPTGKMPVNLYSAYYNSQRKGASIHSPSTCLPGGGWVITDNRVSSIKTSEGPVNVNRVIIKQGDSAQLVYYWFQQRGRDITSEYLAKWYLFQDALLRNRTDGSLIRLTTALAPGENPETADQRLTEILQLIQPRIKSYIPD